VHNINATWDQATPHRCGTTLIALFATLPQMQIKRYARALVRPNVQIEALMLTFVTSSWFNAPQICAGHLWFARKSVSTLLSGKMSWHTPHPDLPSLFVLQNDELAKNGALA
jgi:hypothetical protein